MVTLVSNEPSGLTTTSMPPPSASPAPATPRNPHAALPTADSTSKDAYLLQQQIKLSQLHQLQQLQHHIFQQQMALISGQPTLPAPDLRGVTAPSLRLQPPAFSGLPTPAPSAEIRPMDYNTASPVMNLIGSLNLQHIEPLPISMIPSSIRPPNNIPQRYHHKHSSSLSIPPSHLQIHHQSHASYPSSPSSAFNPMSPTFHPTSPIHLPISHPYHRPSTTRPISQMQPPWQSHPSSSSPSTPISAPPDRFDFTIYGDRNSTSLHSSSTTSPSVLGPGVGSINGGRAFGHLDLLDQDISPLTSPWLGATVSGSTSLRVASSSSSSSNNPALIIHKAEQASKRRTSVSGHKRTASESGDEGDDAWSRGGSNRSSRKRPVLLGSGGSVGSSAGDAREKMDEGKNRGSTSPLTTTSPASELVASPTSLVREGTTTTSSRRSRKGSRSTSSTSTPLLRSTTTTAALTANLMSPFFGVGPASGSRLGGQGQGQGQQELNSPSPVEDLNLEGGQGQAQDGRSNMPPPPLPRGGVDVDMNSGGSGGGGLPERMDDPSSHLRDGGMLVGMGGMGFESMMSLDEDMNNHHHHMVGMGMGGLGGMDGMDGMDMGGMGMVGMDMGMNMGGGAGGGAGMGGFGAEENREELVGMMGGMGYGRDEGGTTTTTTTAHVSSSSARTNAAAGMTQTRLPHAPMHELQNEQQQQQQQGHHQHHLQDQLGGQQQQQQQNTMPVATPSSILNLGRLGGGAGGRLGSALSAGTGAGASASVNGGDSARVIARVKKASKGGLSRKRSSTVGQTTTMGVTTMGVTVGLGPASLKPLRPAATTASESSSPVLSGLLGSSTPTTTTTTTTSSHATLGMGSTPILGSSSSPVADDPAATTGVIRQPKRTHRDAEQRRRNSQKQVIDELRVLLPPIALPSESSSSNALGGGGDSEMAQGTSPFFLQPTATVLPGGLPPRGPPKVGGEGPNKNVSKLQVLLCGNEYIKLLKGRVERRDEEIGRLRREVRMLRGGGGMGGGGGEGGVDLERDLDAVERVKMGAGESSCVQRLGGGSVDEDEDDGDD